MGYRHEPWMDDRLGSMERGENPTVIAKLKSGYAVLGDYQYPPGYCVLMHSPEASALNDLTTEERAQFLSDMALVGDVVGDVCKPAKLNYAIMMNADVFLHAHIQARYAWEPDAYRRGPVWNYPKEQLYADEYFCLNERYRDLQRQLKDALLERLERIGYWEDAACP